MKAVLWSNIYSPTHSTGYAGGVYDINYIIPCIKANAANWQVLIKVDSNEKSNTQSNRWIR